MLLIFFFFFISFYYNFFIFASVQTCGRRGIVILFACPSNVDLLVSDGTRSRYILTLIIDRPLVFMLS